MLEVTRPNWKENTILALFQQGRAKSGPRRKKLRAKQKILKRLNSRGGNEGLFPTQAPGSPRGNILDCEGTVFASPTHNHCLRRTAMNVRSRPTVKTIFRTLLPRMIRRKIRQDEQLVASRKPIRVRRRSAHHRR